MREQVRPPLGDAPVVSAARVGDVMGRLLECSHNLAPDDLPLLLEQELTRTGFTEAVVYLVDHEQRNLVPLPPHADQAVLPVDTTVAGRAFQTEESVEGQGEADARRLWVPLRDGVERLGVLCLGATEFDDELRQHCAHVATLAAELLVAKLQYGDTLLLARRSRPMTLAAELRWAMLPPRTMATVTAGVAAALEPSYEVAGDAFDYALARDRLHLAIFDAMGHGLQASRICNLAVGAYRHSRRLGLGLPEIYDAIDRSLSDQFGPDCFATGQLATVELDTGEVRWVNAGHPGPLLLRHSRVLGLAERAVSLPFGLALQPGAVNVSQLEPEDRMIFYTDGLVEARSPDGVPFGETGLIDIITRSFSERHTLSETVRRIMNAVVEHRSAVLRDDATVLMASWRRPLS